MDKKNMGFFKKIILAMTDFRFYPYILKSEKASRSFGHFFVFLLLLTLIISIKITNTAYENFDVFVEQYDESVPAFSIEGGELTVDFQGTREIRNDLIAIIDTSYTYAECLGAEEYQAAEKYDNRLLINKDIISYIDADGLIYQADLSLVKDTYNKFSLYNYIEAMKDTWETKLLVLTVVFIAVISVYTLYKFIEILMFGVLAILISMIAGIRINFKAEMKIVCYAVTLPYIVETIAIVCTGALKEYAVIASGILAYVYIYYAIRAIKLDMLLMIMNTDKKGAFKLKVNEDGKYECQKVEDAKKENVEEPISEVVEEVVNETTEKNETAEENENQENDEKKEDSDNK